SFVLLLGVPEPQSHVAAHSRDAPTPACWRHHRSSGVAGLLLGCRTPAAPLGALVQRRADRVDRRELVPALVTHSHHCPVHKFDPGDYGAGWQAKGTRLFLISDSS